MDLGLSSCRALVTGASRGIGLGIADALAAEGADVALLARGADGLAAAAQQVGRHGGRVVTRAVDVTDHAALAAAVDSVADELGGLDRLVANAGGTVGGNLLDSVPGRLHRHLRAERRARRRPGQRRLPAPGARRWRGRRVRHQRDRLAGRPAHHLRRRQGRRDPPGPGARRRAGRRPDPGERGQPGQHPVPRRWLGLAAARRPGGVRAVRVRRVPVGPARHGRGGRGRRRLPALATARPG